MAAATRKPIPSSSPSLVRGSLLILTAQVLGNLGFFVAVTVLARELTVSQRGVFAFATTVALVVPRVSELGMGSATTVLTAQRPERPQLLVNSVMFAAAVGVAGAGVVWLIFDLAHVGPGLTRVQLVLIGVGMVGNALLDAGYAFLVGINRLKCWTAVAGITPWLYAAGLLALVAAGVMSVTSALAAWALAHLLWGLAAVAVAVRVVGLAQPDVALLRAALGLGVRAWIGSLSRFLNFRLDQIILGLIAAEATLGVYAVAVNLSEVALYLPGAVATAALAAIAGEADAARRHERVLTTFRTLLLVTAGVVFVGAAVGAPLLPLLFGRSYAASVVPYLVLLPGAIGYVASSVFSSALVSSARPVLSSLGPTTSLLVGVALDLGLIPYLGAPGAAVASTAAFSAGGAAAVVAYRRTAGLRYRELVPARRDAAAVVDVARAFVRR